MELSRLKELIDLMDRNQLEELEVEDGDFKVRLRKKGDKIREVVTVPAAQAPVGGASPVNVAVPEAEEIGEVVPSPMVGTFYRSSSPGSDPFVDEGDKVEEGQVLCIIEAMKVMNEVKSDRAGTIGEILVENGAAVEFNQPLVRWA